MSEQEELIRQVYLSTINAATLLLLGGKLLEELAFV
jgi:hypothetical protein